MDDLTTPEAPKDDADDSPSECAHDTDQNASDSLSMLSQSIDTVRGGTDDGSSGGSLGGQVEDPE